MAAETADDRRGSQRVKKVLPAWYRCHSDTFRRSLACSVGEGGASIWTDEEIFPNQGVCVTLKLWGRLISLRGKAVWTRPAQGPGRFLVGVQFETRDTANERVLRRWHHTQSMKETAWGRFSPAF